MSSHSVSRVSWLSSLSNPDIPDTSGTSSTPGRKRLVPQMMYPIFYELAESVDDPQWKSILLDSSRGKLPKGFIYNGKSLIFRSTGKYVDIVNNHQAAEAFISLVRNNTGFRTEMDLERERDNERSIVPLEQKSWSSITKSNKKLLLIDFVAKLKREYKLTEEETSQVNHLLNFNLKDVAMNKSIRLSDGSIETIENLYWNSGTRTFSLSGLTYKAKELRYNTDENINYVYRPLEIKSDNVSTAKEWNKFLKKLNKSMSQVNRNRQENLPVVNSPRILRRNDHESSDSIIRESSS